MSKTNRNGLRPLLMILCIGALVLSAAPEALAQLGGAGAGGTGGDGRAGGAGGRGSRGEKPPPKKRNEQPLPEPAEARQKLQDTLQAAFSRGTVATPYLMNLFEQASTQTQPASARSRKALAEALSALKGQKLESAPAAALAAPIAAAVNADGIESEDLTNHRAALESALADTELTPEQSADVVVAFDDVIADQQNEAIGSVIEDLRNIQRDGDAGDDLRQSLATNLAALAGDASTVDEETFTKLAERITKACDSSQLTNKEKAQFAYDLQIILNSAGMQPSEFHPVLNQVRGVLKAGLVKPADIQAVAGELLAIHKSLGGGTAAGTAN